jgi:hypothetical protein
MRVALLVLLIGACDPSRSASTGNACGGDGDAIVVATEPQTRIADLKVDSSGVYFSVIAASTGELVFKAPLCGGTASILGSTEGASDACATPVVGPAIALGNTDIYFVDAIGVGSVSKAGGNVVRLDENACGEVGSGPVFVSPFVYWMRSPVTAVTSVADVVRTTDGAGSVAVATGVEVDSAASVTDNTNYYWAGVDGTINRVGLSGGAVTVLASAGGRPVSGMSLDTAFVYFSLSSRCSASLGGPACPEPSATAGTIMRVPISGGATATIATDFDVAGIAVDDRNVYWVDPYDSVSWAPLPQDGTVSSAHVLVQDKGAIVGPALTATSVYWGSEGATVSAIAKPQ